MSSDRLTELQRQRALAQEQLAWIEREIARETGSSTPPPSAPAHPAPPVPPAVAGPAPDPSPADAERIIEKYQATPGSLQRDVRRGCFLYFFAAFALVGLGVTVLWFIFRR